MVIGRKLAAALGAAVMFALPVCTSWASPISFEPTFDSPDLTNVNVSEGPSFHLAFEDIFSKAEIGFVDLQTSTLEGMPNVYLVTGASGEVTLSNVLYVLTLSTGDSGASFRYDNLLYTNSTASVDAAGLLFDAENGGTTTMLNFWNATGGTVYTFSGLSSGDVDVLDTPPAPVVPVPLPASAWVGFSMLAGFGAMFGVRKQIARRRQIV